MVSSLFADALANPTAALVNLYDANEPLDDFPEKVSKHFSEIFGTQQKLEEIPLLGLSNPPECHNDRALVRFYAMIQDTSPSPEMYLARQSAGKCGGWGLAADNSEADSHQPINYEDLRECTVVWAVSLPGQSDWCTSLLEGILQESSPATPKPALPEKYPVPDAPHVGAQIKIYGTRGSDESYKAASLVNFVGILTSEPFYADLESENPRTIPTIHVLFSQTLPTTILPREFPIVNNIDVEKTRNDIVQWIADEALAGDTVAAEWALLCAIARVQSRTPPILPPTLTLSRFPAPSTDETRITPTLYHILGLLFPMLVHIPLSLETLNKTNFLPESKDEDLHSGWLQLPAGSLALITEGGVTEGNISEKGVSNLQAVQEMMTGQTLDYVFPFSRFSFQTDTSFLILTEGRKSTFFKTSITCTLKTAKNEGFNFYKPADSIKLPAPEVLELFRKVVGGAKVGKTIIDPQAAKYIEDDIVSERQKSSASGQTLSPDDLIQTMTVARLIALSVHSPTVTVDIWEKAKVLESERKSRVA